MGRNELVKRSAIATRHHAYNSGMTPIIRQLPFAVADGATNMACDEVMLESAAEHGLASFRFYGWSVPTLSLGYFQPHDSTSHTALQALPWVRRSTGGAGIVHHHELTYSFALPATPQWRTADAWVCRFHRLVRSFLAENGIDSRLVVCGEERKLGDVLCFLHETPGDLVAAGSKVAGSAQRKLRGALLQHGSLLLRKSEFAPHLPGIFDHAETEPFTREDMADALGKAFAHDTGAQLEPSEFTREELSRMREIRAEKYANAEWNERR